MLHLTSNILQKHGLTSYNLVKQPMSMIMQSSEPTGIKPGNDYEGHPNRTME